MMKKILVGFFLLVFAVSIFAQNVYITKSGKKYHTEDCRYLSKSKIKVTLQEALNKGLTACSVCNARSVQPDSTLQKKELNKEVKKQSTKKKEPAYSGRCQAITKKGTQCKRKAKPGSRYCWQHGG